MTATNSLPQRDGLEITWNKLNVTVPDRANNNAPKSILNEVSGCAKPGRLLAIMGASGAGKSTLLDVLAANSASNSASSLTLAGEVLVDGQPRRTRAFRQQSCYVQQRDVLLCAATVREAIATSAALRLPRTLTAERRAERVEEVIRELDLAACADTLIGDETIGLKGVSGGQKRRVSLGIELIKDPAIIFLDEPTSGLDSEMALGVVQALVNLARKNRTVVCTIHQPNSDITALFDDLMLLAGGRVAYAGPWDGAVPAFAAAGFACPMYKNPTDYFISVLHDPQSAASICDAYAASQRSGALPALPSPTAAKAGAAALSSPTGPDALVTVQTGAAGAMRTARGVLPSPGAAGTSTGHLTLEVIDRASPASSASGVAGGITGSGGALVSKAAPATPATPGFKSLLSRSMSKGGDLADKSLQGASWFTQVKVLSVRNGRNWLRNPNLLASELLQYVFISLFMGLMYFDSFTHDLSDGVTNRTACIWFAFAIMCFTPAYTTVTAWDKDRVLLQRELSQRQYSLSAYYVARTACIIPLQAAQCLLFVAVSYFFAGFQRDAGKFFLFFAVLLMFQLISEGLGLVCAIVTRTATYAIIVLTFLLLLLLSFTGFLVTRIPVYFRWLNKASYLTYAFSALTMSEFDGLTFETQDPLDPAATLFVPGSAAVPHSIDNGLTIGENVGILAGMCVFMEASKLFALHVAYKFNLM
uniref:ABC transporter domain-containing protein n=1 Tax=Chlamydomonas leiostraca TaxID=1034604 RepID=A0A7S0WUF3_9CHLO|mmetsp:Transcript_28038/g.71462  ORF Transcript_28038/g.71462 Transcript_28038/m.71462 type:complete len:704 (+) Transcript_28038:108-2219(+)|eukprot:CAMPEP_0202863888 /NCGR_PEP_ID=MMETSP1391-20130828/4344_1 /ASSEMBLY_ACC=CAM_ASM_000867 /TAXON_ID=1034604 /ORGANISM="Chlamydomonas leiostraca, Strain SAG 11-49" /LENGTH=703 /DNA_ID=CAMNT_0049543571 /DNA_START=90 /DNA_END=2201 /DNA_ORIENTATION=-